MKTFIEWLQEGQRDYSATGMPYYSRQPRQGDSEDRLSAQEKAFRRQEIKSRSEGSKFQKALLDKLGFSNIKDLENALDESDDSIVITFTVPATGETKRVYADSLAGVDADRIHFSRPGEYHRITKLADLDKPMTQRFKNSIPYAIIDKMEWASSLGLQPEIEELRQKGKEENIEHFHAQAAKQRARKAQRAKEKREKDRENLSAMKDRTAWNKGTECPSCKTNIPMSSYRTIVDRDGEDMLVPPQHCPNCNVQLAR